MPAEFRGTVTCSQDPCTYCQAPRSTNVNVKSRPTIEEALADARKQAELVWGSSAHFVGVEGRVVTEWREVKP